MSKIERGVNTGISVGHSGNNGCAGTIEPSGEVAKSDSGVNEYCPEYFQWLDKVESERIAAHEMSDADVQSAEDYYNRYFRTPQPSQNPTIGLTLEESLRRTDSLLIIPAEEIPY